MLAYTLLLLGGLGTSEIVLIVILALLLFGGKKIPELARGLGRGIREFKDASNGVKKEIEDGIRENDQNEKK
jgi:sec-independent protein translocase protein TatA